MIETGFPEEIYEVTQGRRRRDPVIIFFEMFSMKKFNVLHMFP